MPRIREGILVASLRRDRAAVLGLFLMGTWLGVAILGPLFVTGDPNDQDLPSALLPPAWGGVGSSLHPFGTDQLGRDIFVRIVHGTRTSLVIGAAVVGIAALVGSLVAVVAAEWGGLVDEVLMRIADVELAIPFLLLAITVLALLGGSMLNMVLVLVLYTWVFYARVVRSELLYLRELEFVLAARVVGASRLRIALRHLLPNAMGLVIVIASLELSNVITLEAALSFLGVGIQPPQVSLGTMVAGGRDYLSSAWWLTTLPGATVALAVLGANLVGDWARDILDPRRRT